MAHMMIGGFIVKRKRPHELVGRLAEEGPDFVDRPRADGADYRCLMVDFP